MVSIGIIGATGYTGVELARLLLQHPQAKIAVLTSEKRIGLKFSEVFPAFQGLLDQPFEGLDVSKISKRIKVAFLCLPHHSAMSAAASFLKEGVKVIDLSADFRLKSVADYELWYGNHIQPALLTEAVYGLPELFRKEITPQTRLLANPGCYPTGAALALAPLIQEKLIHPDSIIIDSKSGVSGAGRGAEVGNLFSEVNEGFKAYKVGSHRHMPEIEQTLSTLAGEKIIVSFTPHLVPMDRGILTTAYAKPLGGKPLRGEPLKSKPVLNSRHLIQIYKKFYQDEPFIRIKEEGVFPNTRDVRTTNYCDIGCVYDTRADRIVILSAVDNLTKGASGQAIQNFNLMMGFNETMGLKLLGHVP